MRKVKNIKKSHNIEIMINDEADEVIKELFKSLKKKISK